MLMTTATAIAYHLVTRAAPTLATVSLAAPSRSHIVMMNRLLLDESECTVEEPSGELVARLGPDDRRTRHVREVLGANDGAQLRAGVLDAGSTNEASVRWVEDGQADAKGAVAERCSLHLSLGPAARMLRPLDQSERPQIDLLLAMPRPKQFARLLPVIASIGVDNLWVTGGARVEMNYFSSHLLRADNTAGLREVLVEGCQQAGDTAVPRVMLRRNLRKLLRSDELTVDGAEQLRLIAHPQRDGAAALRLPDLPARGGRLLLAVGPEGGWDEPAELDLFRERGFEQVTLGPRTLRTDVAVISLLAVANEKWWSGSATDSGERHE